jgi:anti-sigma regulatory factor (Ser/Thr protein kinase)
MSILSNIDGSFESYEQLIDLYWDNKDIDFSTIAISLNQWFAANMSAALGAILDKLQDNFNTIEFTNVDQSIERILQKNDFLSFFNYPSVFDNHHTTIRYLKLKPTDGKFFNNYVFNELLGRDELPKMSDMAKNKIAEAIYEIFVNAQIHSESEHIYTCGQFFPWKDKIEFTIVDVGIGFKNRVNRRFNTKLNAVQAIKWAVQDKSTTKIGISGGIGLAFLKEFIDINKGKMQIISNNGFYQYSEQGENIHLFNKEFPGTIVNLQFRTNDNKSYILKSEVGANDIF